MPKIILLGRFGILACLAGAVAGALTGAGPSRAFQSLPSGKAQRIIDNSAQISQVQPNEPAASPEPQAVAPPSPPSRNSEAPKENEGTPATVIDAQQLESVLGKNIVGPTGENMGRIVDIIANHAGRVRAAIIDFGGFLGVGTRKIAVDWRMLRFPSDGKRGDVTVDLTRDQLRIAPAFTPGEPVVILGRTEATP